MNKVVVWEFTDRESYNCLSEKAPEGPPSDYPLHHLESGTYPQYLVYDADSSGYLGTFISIELVRDLFPDSVVFRIDGLGRYLARDKSVVHIYATNGPHQYFGVTSELGLRQGWYSDGVSAGGGAMKTLIRKLGPLE